MKITDNLMLAKASALRAGFRPDESSELTDKILELYPNEPTAMRMKADILGDKDSVAAVELYDKAAEIVMKTRGQTRYCDDVEFKFTSSQNKRFQKRMGVLGIRFCKRSWYDGAKFNTTS